MEDNLHDAVIAANRFGLGARPDELEDIAHDPREWVLAQLEQPAALIDSLQALDSSPDYLSRFAEYRDQRRRSRQRQQQGKDSDPPTFSERFRDDVLTEMQLRGVQQCATDSPVHERLVMLWSNHFTVSGESPRVRLLAGAFEREAIRPHIYDDFSTLLLSAEQHPAMLLYLDNVASIGPESRVGSARNRRAEQGKGKGAGINENLAREIMELHTLSVHGDYQQQDVIELARALTGWRTSLHTRRPDEVLELSPWGSIFQQITHEPGDRELLGETFDQQGPAQGRHMLRFLAEQPATARFVATKLARHYVADAPPEALVEDLAKSFIRHKGQLLAVYRDLFTHELAWRAESRKFRRPDEYLIALHRALGRLPSEEGHRWRAEMHLLGQPPSLPRTPEGWGDTADDWVGTDALWKRLLIAQGYAQQLDSPPDPMVLAQGSLGPQLRQATARAMDQVNPRQATAILLASPEFQWR
ncbi:DUF1800 domain-containing protein [Halomonas huangheensis]|uniref:DUF1800 domain-containing protein n=1 Tax=Halomonas huangheensis TaxID=1178482 RepID=W1N9X9_9GAMM|nr:DUF1800 domain-containing protein [Halomonas huangheensis]ALM53737.1 hypothetical protein AR456_16740 [Halomonas huangheensis]ERL52347.1 hypothetical protein BJB45_10295 [Halomonas huangheensis]